MLDARPVTRAEDFRRILWETQRLLQREDVRAFARTLHVVLEDFLREHPRDLDSPGALVALKEGVKLQFPQFLDLRKLQPDAFYLLTTSNSPFRPEAESGAIQT